MTKKLKISLALNISVVAMVIFATVSMMCGFRFMGDDGLSLSSTKWGALRFFTVDSNLLMGLIALVFVGFEIALLCGKISRIPVAMYVLKLVGTVGVVLTLLTVVLFLAPFVAANYWVLFYNSNLFFHFVVPVVALVAFVFFEATPSIAWRHSFWGMIPMGVYAIAYTANALAHAEGGHVDPRYDWYYFVQGGLWQAAIVLPMMLVATYAICYGLWLANHALAKRAKGK